MVEEVIQASTSLGPKLTEPEMGAVSVLEGASQEGSYICPNQPEPIFAGCQNETVYRTYRNPTKLWVLIGQGLGFRARGF